MNGPGKTMNETPARSLPAFAQWVLTRRLPCAALVVLLYGGMLLAAGTWLWVPLLALHLLTPALFSLIAMGGGIGFAMQVAAIAAVAVSVALHGDIGPGMLLLILYAALPALAAGTLKGENGLSKSGWNLAIGLSAAMVAVLISGAGGGSLQDVVRDLIAPLFEATRQQGMDVTTVERIRDMTVRIFPGMTALCLWLIWWGDALLARNIAVYYGFFHGDRMPVNHFRLPPVAAYGFAVLVAVAALSNGDIGYLALNIALVTGGLLAAQGLGVAHTWLHARRLQLAATVMYVMLLIQPVMVLPFAVLGLLDIWFDYRRKIMPANGGK